MGEKIFEYLSSFEPVEVITKGEKHYFIEGYASTIDEDLSLETVTNSAQMDILDQIRDRTITMDAEHEIFYDDAGNTKYKPSSPIPLGKIVSADIKPKGVWVKAELNPHCDRFDNIWKSILKGFVHSFSVAFIPLQAIKKRVNGIMKSCVERLNLVNITLTGNPMNPAATFTPVMKTAASLLDKAYLNKEEEINMEKELKAKVKADDEEEKKPTESEDKEEETKKKSDEDDEEMSEDEKKKLKKKAEDSPDDLTDEEKKKLKRIKAEDDAEKEKEDKEEAKEEAVKTKALVTKLQAKLKTLESKIEVLEAKPVMKGRVATQPELNESNSKEFVAFNYIK